MSDVVATYFLAHDGIEFKKLCDAARKEDEDYKPYKFELVSADEKKTQCLMLHKSETVGEAPWVATVADLTGVSIGTKAKGRRHDALLFIPWDGHIFLVSFNNAHYLAKRLPVRHSFGKVVVANAKVDGLRGIKTRVYGRTRRTVDQRAGESVDITEFDYPDALYSVPGLTAKIDEGAPILADGNIGCRYWFFGSGPALLETLEEIYGWWNGGVHTDPAIAAQEHFTEITDLLERDQLFGKMYAAISAGEKERFALAVPDDRLWTAIKHGYNLDGWKDFAPTSSDASVDILKGALDKGKDLSRFELHSDPGDGSPQFTTRFRDLLTFELADDQGNVFVWDSGTWHKARADWVKTQQEESLKFIEDCKAKFRALVIPEWKGGIRTDEDGNELKGEDAYLLVDLANGGFAQVQGIHHKVFPPAGIVKAEICDVHLEGDVLLHVKRGTSFAAVNEATSQALHGCKYAMANDAFCDWANELLGFAAAGKSLRDRNQVFAVGLIVPIASADPSKWSIRALERIAAFRRALGPFSCEPAVLLIEDKTTYDAGYAPPKKKKAA